MSTIQKDQVVYFHYTLTDNGVVIDKSQETPLVYLHGASNIIPGLENALEGKKVGDKLTVEVAPADAYGEINPDLLQEVPREMFQGVDNIEVGMQFHGDDGNGGAPQVVTVKEVNDKTVIIDANHPLAGRDLVFDVEVTEIRAATAEELQHGHAHGAGGHHH